MAHQSRVLMLTFAKAANSSTTFYLNIVDVTLQWLNDLTNQHNTALTKTGLKIENRQTDIRAFSL